MESSPKLLQELSNLTRNLDVLTKEIRESNKVNTESQKTLSKTVENSVKKESQAAKKVSPEAKPTSKTVENSVKKESQAAKKVSPEAKPTSPTSTPTPAESKTKSESSEATGRVAKQAGLGSLKAAGMSFLKGGSIKDVVSAGLKGGIAEGKKGASKEAMDGISSIQTKRDELRAKEKVSPEDKGFEAGTNKLFKSTGEKKEEKKSILDKLNPLKAEKKEASPEEFNSYLASLSRDEKASLINGLESGKITRDDLQKMIREREKSEGSTPGSEDKGSKKSEKKGFFSSLIEKIKPKEESKEVEPKNEKAKSSSPDGKPSPDGKTSSESVTKSPELTEGQKIKESLKKSYEESSLGKTVSGVKSLIKGVKKRKEENSEDKAGAIAAEMKKQEQVLKSESSKGTPSPASTEKSSSVSATPEVEAAKNPTSPASTSASTSAAPSTSTKSASASSSSTPSAEGISSQDIQDIKSLLSSINTTLSGPLRIKDNKPFRPKSSMLE